MPVRVGRAASLLGERTKQRNIVAMLMKHVPGQFSVELGLDLQQRHPRDLFLWFLGSLLYGTRISGTIVRRTHAEFVRRGLTTPEGLRQAGWDRLVEMLDAGGYVRYDFKTATKLLEVMGSLLERYGGDLNQVHLAAKDKGDLQARLRGLGKGIGEVTVQIFLRELRDLWPKAQPELSPLASLALDHLQLLDKVDRKGLDNQVHRLRRCWQANRVRSYVFQDFESALVRLGRDYCRSGRWNQCPMHPFCPKGDDAVSPGDKQYPRTLRMTR